MAGRVDEEELEWRFRGAEGEWYERHTISQDLPELATAALCAGWDTPALRVLAGEPASAHPVDLGELFARVCEELGRPTPTAEQARLAFVQYLAWLIVTDRLGPLDGAERMERIHWWDPPEIPELGHISGLVDEWQGGWGRPRREVEVEIRRAAQDLLAEPLAG